VRIVFPSVTIPLRMTGVAIRQDGTWRLVQLHVSAAVSDEDLLAQSLSNTESRHRSVGSVNAGQPG
jgi:hypothetical protein